MSQKKGQRKEHKKWDWARSKAKVTPNDEAIKKNGSAKAWRQMEKPRKNH